MRSTSRWIRFVLHLDLVETTLRILSDSIEFALPTPLRYELYFDSANKKLRALARLGSKSELDTADC